MTYVIGIDGGGTKTETVLCDVLGNLKGYWLDGSSNHQIVGLQKAVQTIRNSIEQVMTMGRAQLSEIAEIYIGIAGADSEADKRLLLKAMKPFLDVRKITLTNDCWIALSAASSQRWGAISVCGTGNNACIRDPDGREYALRGLQYEYGNLGGGNQIVREALHHAFRADEGTGRETRLRKEIPHALGFSDMNALCTAMYWENYRSYDKSDIVRRVFLLANEGDEVCQDILIGMGRSIGDMLGRFIRHVKLDCHRCVPVILSGSIYHKSESLLMIDALRLALRIHVPFYNLLVNVRSPVLGACYEGLLHFDKQMDYTVIDRLEEQLPAFQRNSVQMSGDG